MMTLTAIVGTMRIAAVQMCSTSSVSENLKRAEALLLRAKDKGAKLVAFPENFTLMAASPRIYLEAAETVNGTTLSTLKAWAKREKLWIVAGSLPIKSPGQRRVHNSAFVISDQGKISARYDKIHLFDATVKGDRAYRESSLNLPGKNLTIAKTPLGSLGLSICYDLRFPELYRLQAQRDPGLAAILIPAAFTRATGEAHWDVLTRARAIENQCYVIAPAQSGKHADGRETFGHTRVVDPWGTVIAELATGEGIVLADVATEKQSEVRAGLPALKNRRIRLIGKYLK